MLFNFFLIYKKFNVYITNINCYLNSIVCIIEKIIITYTHTYL